MILIGISEPERRTLFDRIRPLLAGQRPQEAALLLQLWRVALDDARAASGSIADLTGRLVHARRRDHRAGRWHSGATRPASGRSGSGQRAADRQDRRLRGRGR